MKVYQILKSTKTAAHFARFENSLSINNAQINAKSFQKTDAQAINQRSSSSQKKTDFQSFKLKNVNSDVNVTHNRAQKKIIKNS